MRTPSPKEQRRPRKQPHPKRAVPIEEEMRGEEQQKYHKSTSSQVRIGSLENLSQNVEELPSLPQPFVAEQRQILTDELVKIKPQMENQPVVHSPPRTRIKESPTI